MDSNSESSKDTVALVLVQSQETESLVKRLAGPSSGKAGFVRHFHIFCFQNFKHRSRLAKDQTEINRIIAEASKGSKFYDVSVEGDLIRLTTLILYYILE